MTKLQRLLRDLNWHNSNGTKESFDKALEQFGLACWYAQDRLIEIKYNGEQQIISEVLKK